MIELKRRIVSAAAVLLAGTLVAAAAPPKQLISLESVRRLSNAEAGRGIPVSIEATVTYIDSKQNDFIVQDGAAGLRVITSVHVAAAPGDRVLIQGVTREGAPPCVVSSQIQILAHGMLPMPAPASYEDLLGSADDFLLITTHGTVRSADFNENARAQDDDATLKILNHGHILNVEIDHCRQCALGELLNADVAVTGVALRSRNAGTILHVASLRDVYTLKNAVSNPWSLPTTPLDQIQSSYHLSSFARRVRVSGVVTYYEPASALVLQENGSGVWISTRSYLPLHLGDRVDAIGVPTSNNGLIELTGSEFRDAGATAPTRPEPATWQQLASGQDNFKLVSIEGEVAVTASEAAQDEYVLISNGYTFSAIYRHPLGAWAHLRNSLRALPVGAKIRVTGICEPLNSNSLGHNEHFNLLLRSRDDLTVLSAPSFLNTNSIALLFAGMLILALAIGVRGWHLEYKNRRKIVSLAYMEQRRARILEDINQCEPLAGTIERITELVSARLNGAACWCNLIDGATLGNRPGQISASSLRVLEIPICSRSGPALGSLSAAFDARTWPCPAEQEALAMAASLATLAIETSRLYIDLIRRSEIDLLTDVQNRFVLEKRLAAMIQSARQSAGVFGLIYIDLDQFKRVNDMYGHLVGDRYLQEVAQRMKRQLRPGDTLARLGGDEFAVLVQDVRARDEVEEIALRLRCCFLEPFITEGCVLKGSASVGVAVYPEDGESIDNLLNTADAAMYSCKNSQQCREWLGATMD